MAWKDRTSWSLHLLVPWVLYALAVGSVVEIQLLTLAPDGRKRGVLHPWLFQDIRSLFVHGLTTQMIMAQVVGNVALFVPLGFFLPLAVPALDDLGRMVLVGCAVSVLVETAQYLLPIGRTASLDDVLLHTAGTLCGFLLMRAVRHLRPLRGVIGS